MFGWLKGKKQKEQEILETMIRAAAEGNSRAKVNRAIGSFGIQLAHEPDNALYCIEASSAIVKIISSRANDPIEKMKNSEDKFVAGIFSFVVSDHLTRIIGVPFEAVAIIVPIDLFGDDYAKHVSSLAGSFNAMSQQGKVIEAIGQNIAKWIAEPTDERMSELIALYQLCKKHA